MTSVPEFIVKGAKILSIAWNNPLYDITPAFLREVKFNEVSIEWRDKVAAYAETTGFQAKISPLEFVHELSKRAISAQIWRKNREQQLFSNLIIQCPHICPPCCPITTVLQQRKVNLVDEEINIDILNGIVMKYSRILSKIPRLKALKMKRANLIKENIQLLGEVTDIANISVRTLQNIADGVSFSDLFSEKSSSTHVSILEEMHRLSELLQGVEDDQKDEDMFWKWLLSSTTYITESASTAVDDSKIDRWMLAESLLRETDNAVKSYDSKIAELTADRKLQIYEHSDELINVLSIQLEALVNQILSSGDILSVRPLTASMESSFMEECSDLWSQVVSDMVELSNAQSPFMGNIASKPPLDIENSSPQEPDSSC